MIDGVVDFDKYINPTKPRVLWILKEPNGKSENDPVDYRTKISKGCCGLTTYGRILQVSYGIFAEHSNWNSDLQIKRNKWGPVIGKNDEVILDEIAVININKSGGEKYTPPEQWNENIIEPL